MKYFLDTEFIEDGKTIDLLSIGIVCEDGREFYMESKEADLRKADDWVRENVFPSLHITEMKSRHDIRVMLERFIGDDKPQFFAYFADYDWVALCQLFGRMIDLPKNFPMYCMDLKQMMKERGLDHEWKEQSCPQKSGHHNALEDAKWNKKLYETIAAITLPTPK